MTRAVLIVQKSGYRFFYILIKQDYSALIAVSSMSVENEHENVDPH